jgi:predicted metal-binding membrane protein
MATELRAGWRLRWSSLLSQDAILLFLAASAAWLILIVQAQGMGAMGGTMGLGLGAFIALWTVMMAAMMLPAVAPVATLYARSTSGLQAVALAAFAIGYLAVWALLGVLAYPATSVASSLAMNSPAGERIVAAVAFLVVALYQLSPIKGACLVLGRPSVGHTANTAQNPLVGLAAGGRDGLACVASSWALMLVMVPIGFMNLPLMLALAAVVFVERYWSHGLALARVVGVAALVLALASIWVPQLSHNLG